MSVVDRFVCRREGHKPSVTITRVVGIAADKDRLPYFTTCRRCGKWYEAQTPRSAEQS